MPDFMDLPGTDRSVSWTPMKMPEPAKAPEPPPPPRFVGLPEGVPRLGGKPMNADGTPAASFGKLEPAYTESYKAWKENANPATRSGLLKAVQPVIQTALRSYGADSPVMRNRAKLLAADAIDTYDPNRGSLKTHLLSQLVGIQRFNARQHQVVSVPEQVALDSLKLRRTAAELDDELGREPSTQELADRLGMSMKRIAYVRQYRPPVATGQLASTNSETGETEEFTPDATSLAMPKPEDDPWLQYIYQDLDGVDQSILDLTMGLHGRSVVQSKEVARRLGISPGAVSQRLAKIQRLLDEREQHNLF